MLAPLGHLTEAKALISPAFDFVEYFGLEMLYLTIDQVLCEFELLFRE